LLNKNAHHLPRFRRPAGCCEGAADPSGLGLGLLSRITGIAEFSAQCTQCIGRTLELTPGYVVQSLGLAFDLQSVATLHDLKPTRKKMLQSECLEPSWHKHPLKFELGFKSRADLVEWRRWSAPDLPFYNHIMSNRIETGVWRTNQQNYAKQANSRIDDDSEDDEWE
jgi:hypothetical protein